MIQKQLICGVVILGLLSKLDAQTTKAYAASVPMPQMPYPQVPQVPMPTLQGIAIQQQQQVQQQNNAMIQADLRQYERQQQKAQGIIDEAVNEFQPIQYELPDKSQLAETKLFRNAFNSIDSMLTDKQDLSLKKAVFDAENAWYGGLLNYQYFCTEVSNMVDIINSAIKQEGHSTDNDLAKKWMLHRFMSDTLRLKDEKGNITFTHLPYQYDFEDIHGKDDWSKMFVTKLMRTRKGQCRSMPLLYLILAEELGVKAWLTYSPSHTYIRLQDDKKNWYNLELTNGHYSADSWVLSSGFIKAEALKNQLYMDTLSKKEVIAGTLNELSKGYGKKFGYDNFVLQCAEKTLAYHSNDVHALQMKADWATMRFKYVLHQLNYPPKDKIHLYPKAHQILQEMYGIYKYIDQTGYEQMPEEVYKAWLKTLNDEKAKQVIQVIKP